MRLLIMGSPGSGKGTQATRIAARFNVPAISTGDIFRAHVAASTPLGVLAREYMDVGEYVPDSVTNSMVRERLELPDCSRGFILDGYPRTIQQADELDGVLADAGTDLAAVIELVVDPDLLLDRMLLRSRDLGRVDDTLDVIGRRQELYIQETAPLTDRYAEQGLLHVIDGEGQIGLVTARITDSLVEALSGTRL
jgi:adenylate kinase